MYKAISFQGILDFIVFWLFVLVLLCFAVSVLKILYHKH